MFTVFVQNGIPLRGVNLYSETTGLDGLFDVSVRVFGYPALLLNPISA